MLFIDQVKQWFRKNLKPSEGQFWSWLNWVRWKDEAIGISEVTDLQNQLNALGQPIQKFAQTGTFIYEIPAGYIVEWLLIKPSTDCTVTLDDGNGNVNDIDVQELHGEPIICMYNAGVDRDIEITGLPPKTLVYVKRYKLPVNIL
jgi:hypothetical protein